MVKQDANGPSYRNLAGCWYPKRTGLGKKRRLKYIEQTNNDEFAILHDFHLTKN
jgi:hypothetical protein